MSNYLFISQIVSLFKTLRSGKFFLNTLRCSPFWTCSFYTLPIIFFTVFIIGTVTLLLDSQKYKRETNNIHTYVYFTIIKDMKTLKNKIYVKQSSLEVLNQNNRRGIDTSHHVTLFNSSLIVLISTYIADNFHNRKNNNLLPLRQMWTFSLSIKNNPNFLRQIQTTHRSPNLVRSINKAQRNEVQMVKTVRDIMTFTWVF